MDKSFNIHFTKIIIFIITATSCLFFTGCVSQEEIYGCYGTGDLNDSMKIVTPSYILDIPSIRKQEWKSFHSFKKHNYELKKLWNGYVIRGDYWFCYKKILFIPYEDNTYWKIFLLDGIHVTFFPKLSDKKALKYLRQRNLDLEQIKKLPIHNNIGRQQNIYIKDDSLPEILQKMQNTSIKEKE